MSDVSVWDQQLQTIFSFSQPSRPSQEQINGVAQEHLDAAGQTTVNGWNSAPLPEKFVFFATILQGIAGFWVETHTNPDGSSEWSGGGTAYGELEYTTSKNLESKASRRASKKY